MYCRTKMNVSGVAYMNVDAGKYRNDQSRLSFLPESEESLNAAIAEPAMTIYPNPARNQIHVKVWQANAFNVQFIRLNGSLAKELNSKAANGEISLSVQELTPGSYILQLKGDDGKVESQKLVVE